MSKHSLTIIVAAAFMASLSSAHAGLLTSPIALRLAVDASRALTKADLRDHEPTCMLRSDDVFAGPVTLWVC
jgi:hypothetical protein